MICCADKNSAAHCASSRKGKQRIMPMTDLHAAPTWWRRRDFLKTSAAVAATAYAMRWGAVDAAEPPLEYDGSKFELKAAEPIPSTGASFAWASRSGRRISTC